MLDFLFRCIQIRACEVTCQEPRMYAWLVRPLPLAVIITLAFILNHNIVHLDLSPFSVDIHSTISFTTCFIGRIQVGLSHPQRFRMTKMTKRETGAARLRCYRPRDREFYPFYRSRTRLKYPRIQSRHRLTASLAGRIRRQHLLLKRINEPVLNADT